MESETEKSRLPSSRFDDPTLDPVERERALLFGDPHATSGQAGNPQSELPNRQSGKWTLLSKLAVTLSIGLLIGYLLLWAQVVQTRGGPESYVRGTDFLSTLTGAQIIREGNGSLLYDLNTQTNAQYQVRGSLAQQGDKLLPYNHLPFEALLIAPFMDLPYPVIFALWTLLAGFAIGLSLGMLDGTLPGTRPLGWVLSMAACSYLPLMRALMLGQNSPLVLLGLCATYSLLRRGGYGWAGVAMLLIALKPQVLPLVALLMLLQGYWRSLFVFAGLLGAGSIVAMFTLGTGWIGQYLKLLLGVVDWSYTGVIDPAIMHNWRGLGVHLFGGWLPALETPFYVLMSLLSVALLIWAWYRSRGLPLSMEGEGTGRGEYRPVWDILWALAVVLSVLVSPHLNPHDLTLLIFPAWIVGAYAASGIWGKTASRVWTALLVGGYLLFPITLALVGDTGNQAIVVVPSVLLLAGIAWLLAHQIVRPPAVISDPLNAPGVYA